MSLRAQRESILLISSKASSFSKRGLEFTLVLHKFHKKYWKIDLSYRGRSHMGVTSILIRGNTFGDRALGGTVA